MRRLHVLVLGRRHRPARCAVLLRDLLADPELGLVLLTGEDRIDRPVRGVYITDLLDPRRYLEGGELVLSGLVWHHRPDDSEQFVAALADAGVAGLAAGTARLGNAPPDLVDACRRHGVPAFEVPVAVSFNTLAEKVLRRDAASRHELVSAVAAGADLPRVLGLAANEFGADCWVLSATGWRVGGAGELADRTAFALVREFLESDRLPRTVRCGAESFVLCAAGSDAEPRAARWFAAVRGDQRQWIAEQEAAAADLATAVALLRTRVDEARQIAARPVEAVLRRLLDGTAGPPEVAARLETAGLPPGEPLRVVVLGTVDRATVGQATGDQVTGDRGTAATALLREIAASTGMPSVTTPSRDGATALFVDDEAPLSGLDRRLRRVAAEIEPGLTGLALTVGVSDISPPTGLRGALQEATYARRLAEDRSRAGKWSKGGKQPGGGAVVTGAELASHQVLLASVPDELRRSYRQRLLSTLITYDRKHHSDLVHTLRMFLECSGSWSRCAKRLHVHVNTLRYRIRRIEELTGRDLSEFTVRVDFHLALELDADRPLVQPF